MNQTDDQFSTQKISPQLIAQIIDALKNKAWGSIEIYIENHTVTQITERTITKVAKPNPLRPRPASPRGESEASGQKKIYEVYPRGVSGEVKPQ